MNIESFRNYLRQKDGLLDSYWNSLKDEIQSGHYTNVDELWANKDLCNCKKIRCRSGRLIFPWKVNILTSSIFYERIYILLDRYDKEFREINNKDSFKDHYQLYPNEFLKMIKIGKVVPIFDLKISTYNDFYLKNLIFPIITSELPYLTFEGHALISQIWQFKHQALPDPREGKTYGFLMDLCGSMGIGATLIRPEIDNNFWDNREMIFNLLKFDEIAKNFINREITLNDYFIAVGIDFDSSLSLKNYLSIFDNIDEDKIFSLYEKVNKVDFYSEIIKLNSKINDITKSIDQIHSYKKILSIPITLAFCIFCEIFWEFIPVIVPSPIKDITKSQLEKILKQNQSKFSDLFYTYLNKHKKWLNKDNFPDVLELAKLKIKLNNS